MQNSISDNCCALEAELQQKGCLVPKIDAGLQCEKCGFVVKNQTMFDEAENCFAKCQQNGSNESERKCSLLHPCHPLRIEKQVDELLVKLMKKDKDCLDTFNKTIEIFRNHPVAEIRTTLFVRFWSLECKYASEITGNPNASNECSNALKEYLALKGIRGELAESY